MTEPPPERISKELVYERDQYRVFKQYAGASGFDFDIFCGEEFFARTGTLWNAYRIVTGILGERYSEGS